MKSMKSTIERTDEEEVLKILGEKSPVGVCIVQDGKFCYVNSNFPIAIDYTADELVGKDSLELIVPEDREMVRENEIKMLKGELLSPYQFRVIHKEGSIRWVMEAVRSVQYHGRRAVLGNYMGVTGRKKMEEVLRQSEERYRTILQEMGDGYFETDLAGNLTFANDALINLLGYSREELIGMNYRAFTPEEDVKSLFEAYNHMYRTGEPLRDFGRRVIRKDSTYAFAQSSAFPIKNDKGEIIGFRGVRHDITERKQAEEALQRSEERYRTILEEMEDAYFEVDLGGHITFANNSTCRDLGYSREELIGMSYKGFTIEEDFESVFRVFNEVYRTGAPNKGFPWKTVRKDGVCGFAETSVSTLRNDKGEIIGFRGVGRDITERKEMEEALRESEKKLRLISENSRDIICLHDPDHRYVYISPACKEILGYEPDELVETNPWELVHPEDIEALQKEGQEKALQGMPVLLSYRIRKKSGEYVWFESVSQLLKDGAGNVLGFVTSSRDVTKRKQAEDKLRQSEENYRVLFDSMVIGTIVLDAETMKIAMVNQAAAKMFGFSSAEEARGADPLDFVRPEDKERISKIAAENLFGQDSRQTYELGVVTRDGREIWINATGASIMHEGKLGGLISFTDITEQKRQRERLMMTDRLASLGELAAGTAHELNNPLTSIIGFSQLLMEKETPDDIREDLKLINNEAQRAVKVTRDLLTFARKHTPVKQHNQINSIIEGVLELRAYLQKTNGIEVERQLDPDLPEIMVDYFQLQQVLLNIIINAEYFMTRAHNKGTLTITTKKQNSSVVISIADDGPGILPENLRRIFDPFFTTKEAGNGTGLGLSICHGIVNEHGGQIYVKSQLGKGATIFVELPINGHNHIGGGML